MRPRAPLLRSCPLYPTWERGDVARRILVTGGTVFVSRYIARHFVGLGDDVVVLNRNTRPQERGVSVVDADRHALGDVFDGERFDAVVDVNAYDARDVVDLVRGLERASFDSFVMISSSAVYPETNLQPFAENVRLGLETRNAYWGRYSEGKIAAERALLECVDHAYVVRPPYLYGPMNNLYREAFVFDCADADRVFRMPGDGAMRLQFLHVRDLCRFIDLIVSRRPQRHVFNVGNPETVSVRDWVDACYRVAGKRARVVGVRGVEQRSYFPFHDYEYELDVSAQCALMPTFTDFEEGLRESYAWHRAHADEVDVKPYMRFIDEDLGDAAAIAD